VPEGDGWKMATTTVSRLREAIIPFVTGAVIVMALAMPARAAVEVGAVQLLLGKGVSALGADGQRRILRQGAAVFEGDLLETAAGTVAHLKMRDGAFISLRPGTRLRIACYHAEPTPCIRLELKKGEIRERTGRIGERHKRRFRLNTPVAAIGIRGTDFVTRSEAGVTLIRVIAGEVVAAPFGDGCDVKGVGPCASPWAVGVKFKPPNFYQSRHVRR